VLRAVLGDDALAAMVEVACATPARMAGVYPRKGTVQTGSDADLVIWGDEPWTIGAADLHDAVGATPYEGLSVRSRPELVISRGEVIVGGGGEGLRAGRGRFLSA